MPPHHLRPRAQLTLSTGALVAILVGLVAFIVFCLVVLFFMWKRKRTLAARQRDLTKEQRQPFVAQGPDQHVDQHANPRDDQRAHMGTHGDGPIELQGRVLENTQDKHQQNNGPQQLDGYAAPATMAHDSRPAEMEAR